MAGRECAASDHTVVQRRCSSQGAHQLGGLSSVAGLQLTSGHDDGVDAKLLVCERALRSKGVEAGWHHPDADSKAGSTGCA
jgi:hypothetical protein